MTSTRAEIEALAEDNGWSIRDSDRTEADTAESAFGELVTYGRGGIDVMIVWAPNGTARSVIRNPSARGGQGRADFARIAILDKAREWFEDGDA